MMEWVLYILIAFTAILTGVLFYNKYMISNQPTQFNDMMSYYVWKSKKHKVKLRQDRYKTVKRFYIKKKLNYLDSKVSDKIHDVASKIDNHASAVSEHVKEKHKAVKQKINDLKPEKKISNKERILSQLHEVYKR